MNFCPLKMLTRNVECDFLGDFQTLCEHVIFVYKIKFFFFKGAPQMSKSHLFLESWHFKFMVIVICQQVTRESINSFFSLAE